MHERMIDMQVKVFMGKFEQSVCLQHESVLNWYTNRLSQATRPNFMGTYSKDSIMEELVLGFSTAVEVKNTIKVRKKRIDLLRHWTKELAEVWATHGGIVATACAEKMESLRIQAGAAQDEVTRLQFALDHVAPALGYDWFKANKDRSAALRAFEQECEDFDVEDDVQLCIACDAEMDSDDALCMSCEAKGDFE